MQQRQGLLNDFIDGQALSAAGSSSAKGAQVGDNLRSFANLLHGAVQFVKQLSLFSLAHLNLINDIADEQADVIERVVQLMSHAGRQLAQRGKLSCLHQLLLFVAKLLLSSLNLGGSLLKIAHHVNHGFATVLQAEVRLMGILKNVQKRASGIV